MTADERPEALRAVLQRVLRQSGFAGRLEQTRIVERWGELVGPYIGGATRAELITADSVLIVSVKTNAWMSELALLEPEILAAINRAVPANPIRRIRWQLMR